MQVISFIPVILVQLPLYLVWLVGIILAIAFWRRHPRVSLLTIIALVLFLLEGISGLAFTLATPFLVRGAIANYMALNGILSVVQGIVSLIAWIILLVALFGWRQEAAKQAST